MHIRTFTAASLQEALEEIRQQMGPDASVLHTRQVREGLMGWLGKTYVEVTAGLKDGAAGKANEHANTDKATTDDFPATVPMYGSQNRLVSFDSQDVSAGEAVASRVSVGNSPSGEEELPVLLKAYRDELLSTGVDPVTADRWMTSTLGFAAGLGEPTTGRLSSSVPWLEHLQRSVAREIRLGAPIRTQPGQRSIVALVGPTGVGKTTTVAKLAAGFRLQAKRRVGLLTIDTFRIAAVQQLRAYAEIMDLPMEVVEQPGQMRPALGRLGDVDLVLIDTAGRSPRSDARIEQLVEFLRNAQPDETHLVLSSTSSAASLRATIKGFAPVRPTAAILSKLDETPNMAGVLSALATPDEHSALPLSYTTNGQQVPDDIETAQHESLLHRMMTPLPFTKTLETA